MPEHCPRCEATLPLIDGSRAAFCAICGLPQLRVPEEAQEPAPVLPAAGPGSLVLTGAVEWTLAFRVLLVAALLGLVPSLLKPEIVVVGGGGFLTLLLLPLLTLGSGAAYLRRRPYPPFTPGMGARMGVVLALLLSAALAIASGVAGFVLRYGMHSHIVRGNLDLAFQEFATRMNSTGTPVPALLQWPEARAGVFLFVYVFTCALLLLVGAVAGAVAGALLGGQQRRSRR